MVRGTLGGLLTPFAVSGGHERALMPLLVLLFVGTVGGAFAGVLILLCLAFEAGGDVEELLGGSRALASQLVNQGLTGCPRQEGPYDVGVGNVG